MLADRTTCPQPVRYTAATMEQMRLEDVQHVRCGVNYGHDHSLHCSADKVSLNYFANKEWVKKDQEKTDRLQEFADTREGRRTIKKRARSNVTPPFAWDGHRFYAHREASCFGYVDPLGRSTAFLTGIDIQGSHPKEWSRSQLHESRIAPSRPAPPNRIAKSRKRAQSATSSRKTSEAPTRTSPAKRLLNDKLLLKECARTVAAKVKDMLEKRSNAGSQAGSVSGSQVMTLKKKADGLASEASTSVSELRETKGMQTMSSSSASYA